jgi:hypothetical protein
VLCLRLQNIRSRLTLTRPNALSGDWLGNVRGRKFAAVHSFRVIVSYHSEISWYSDGSKYNLTRIVWTTRTYFLLKLGSLHRLLNEATFQMFYFPLSSFLDLAPTEFNQRLFVDLGYAGVAGRDEWVVSIFPKSLVPQHVTWDFDQYYDIEVVR